MRVVSALSRFGRRPLAVCVAPVLVVGCLDTRGVESGDAWFDAGVDYGVTEYVAFTDVPYEAPEPGLTGIGDLPMPPDIMETWYGLDDVPPDNCDDWVTDASMPAEVEGIITIHPRFYYKTQGCVAPGDRDTDSDEKYYGSYFIQDATGGIFVLGDSKVAHFDMGDRVRMKVRAVRNIFELHAVAAHDVLEVERGPEPIYYEWSTEALGEDDVGLVKRVEGEVVIAADTFGEFQIESDAGVRYTIGLDVELNRRGLNFPLGTRIQATGPTMFAYETYKIVIMRVGQVEVL